MVMFTPMNGRRSLIGKRRKRSTDFDPEMSKIILESIRFFVKHQTNPGMNHDVYKSTVVNPTFKNSNSSQLIMNHIMNWVIKNEAT